MSLGQPRILFVSLSDDVGSERIVSEMGRRGAICAVLGRRTAIAAGSRHVWRHSRLLHRGGLWAAARAVPRRLDGIAAAWHPDAVVPLDDMAAHVLRDVALRHRTSSVVREVLVASLGEPAHYHVAGSRALLIARAAALGLCTPAQRSVMTLPEAEAAADALGYPVMLKREGTCGGCGVTLVRDGAELGQAFRSAMRRARVKRALQAVIGLRPAGDDAPLTLQDHVAGPLAMRTVACAAGRVLAGLSLAALHLDPPVTGSSTVVRPIDHPEMAAAAARLVADLGCSGFVSFDFILGQDGSAHLIEMNARPVGSDHIGARFGHDLYGAWLHGFAGFRDADPPLAAEAPCPVALFPKEFGRDPASPHLAPGADALHDVPWDEPRIIAAYALRLARRHPDEAAALARRLGAPREALARGWVPRGDVRPRGLWT